jgi:hypothetical protein
VARNKGGGDISLAVEPRVNVNIKVLPFGQISIEIKGGESTEREAEQPLKGKSPFYIFKPNIIVFPPKEYRVPQTTGGI